MNIDIILEKCNLSKNDVFAAYVYGSKVYGTDTPKSDNDIVIVTNFTGEQSFDNYDCHFYTIADFQSRIDEHEVSALECLWLEPEKFFSNHDFNFSLDHSKLRKSFSQKSSNSFVKAKKKLQVEHDYYIGKKSLWHCFRILSYGFQIATHGKIVDYKSMNYLYDEIVNCENNDWNYYFSKYKQLYNTMKTDFRKVAEK